jgi:sister chromatid cohesion protein PDS5
MPARSRNSARTDAAPTDRGYDVPGLNFSDTLSWRAGKAIPVGDLLTRLQKLAAELRSYDLDQVNSQSFTRLAQDLANANLLAHKDKGVRAWTVSCVVDVLKICAPDAPFLQVQLKVKNIP